MAKKRRRRKARHFECSLEAYHARHEWGNSQLNDAVNDDGSWPLFHGLHVADPREYTKLETQALDVGTVAHAALTSPGGLDEVVTVIPEEVLNADGDRRGGAWKEWSAENAGKIQMKRWEFDPVRRMVRSVYNHPRGAWLMEHALHYEFSLVWDDRETGLGLRARPDLLVQWRGRVFAVDFKTTRCRTPREFVNAALELGYHRQAAWYIEAVKLFGYDVAPSFTFLTVDKSPAHECRIYELPERAVALGQRENVQNRRELARRLDEDDWTDPLAQEAIEIDLPRYVYENERTAA